MTKQDLLARAKELNIVGRYDMTVDELTQAIDNAGVSNEEINEIDSEIDENDDDIVENEETNTDDVVIPEFTVQDRRNAPVKADTRAIYSSRPRDEVTGKVIRKGKNLSGNVPYAEKYYTITGSKAQWSTETMLNYTASPKQLRGLVDYMLEDRTPARGCTIADNAKEFGYLNGRDGNPSRIDSAVLFAYYVRIMEKHFGVVECESED